MILMPTLFETGDKDEILADYEDLEREDILAALAYAARIARVKSTSRLAA
jgi:uncharacterized protein (DUF433 family)